MRKTHLFLMCGAVAVLGMTGCNRETAETDVATTTTTTPAETTMPAEPAAPAVPAPAPEGALTLATAPAGSYVADNTGRAVYVLKDDDSGAKCTGDCLKAWTPLLSTAEPTAGSSSLQGTLVGTLQRADGTTQVTYNGHPLYLYVKDSGAGSTAGQDVTDQWGEWYLVGPSGMAMDDDKDSSAGVTAEVPPEMDPVDPVKTDAPPPTY